MGKTAVLKLLKGVEDVAGAIPRATATSGGGAPLTGLDLAKAAEANRGRVDGVIGDEIAALTEAQVEAQRVDRVTNPKASINEIEQTATPEEFAVRYNDQLKDTDYAKRSGYNVDEEVGAVDKLSERVVESRQAHEAMSSDIFDGLNANPRWKANYERWDGGSPYNGEMNFHVDVRTDPTNPNRLIQYDKPRQGGVHMGTNRAAELVPGMMIPDEFILRSKELQADAETLVSLAGIPIKELHNTIGGYISKFKLRQFSKAHGEPVLTMGEVYDEWDAMIKEIAEQLGTEYGPAAKALASDFMRMPTPNTTPVVFRGKNGLVLQDTGGFDNGEILDQLYDFFKTEEDWKALDIAAGGVDEFAITKNIQQWIESKGYDHIIYHNTVEDVGSLSIINWNEDLMKNVWDPEFYTVPTKKGNAAIATSVIMGALGLGVGSANIRTKK